MHPQPGKMDVVPKVEVRDQQSYPRFTQGLWILAECN